MSNCSPFACHFLLLFFCFGYGVGTGKGLLQLNCACDEYCICWFVFGMFGRSDEISKRHLSVFKFVMQMAMKANVDCYIETVRPARVQKSCLCVYVSGGSVMFEGIEAKTVPCSDYLGIS